VNLGRRRTAEPSDPRDTLRALRVEAARQVPAWEERQETDLVKRGPYLVDVDTDRLYTRYAGTVFASGEAKPTFGERNPLLFFVTDDDRLVFLEPAGSRTWSEIVARQAWRQRVSA
jgi:hypothetical protein